jgi:hypothetical protein
MRWRAVRWQAVAGVVALGLISWAAFELSAEPRVTQPIQFPHKTHVELSLQCASCHDRAERDAVAGRPPTAFCLSCHSGGDATAEIKKIQAFEQGGEIPWKRVWRLPSHVYFPHRTHVVTAEVACQTCHGPMETLDRPPARPLRKLAMDDCIGCHEKRNGRAERSAGPVAAVTVRTLSTDCIACHR